MIFTIKKGKHFSNQFLYKMYNFFNFKKKVEYIVKFPSSCIYELNKKDQMDINKLFGFSLGVLHHQNSVRFGWNYLEGKIILHAYCYEDGKRNNSFITRIPLDQEFKLGIFVEENVYTFVVENLKTNHKSKVKMYGKQKFKFGYNLWPYFGGNNPAPHDMSIELTKIN